MHDLILHFLGVLLTEASFISSLVGSQPEIPPRNLVLHLTGSTRVSSSQIIFLQPQYLVPISRILSKVTFFNPYVAT